MRGWDEGREGERERESETEDVIMAELSSPIFDVNDSIILT